MQLTGTGVPMITPFGEDGTVRDAALESITEWLVDGGVDFLVPCGSNGEAAMCSPDERAHVIDVVTDQADVPVLAGTGTPSLQGTLRATERAAEAGADAALVVTPYYHQHDAAALSAYYRELADRSPLPIYLYSVPKYTGVTLEPRTVEALATHENLAGMKDSSGDLERLQRYRRFTADESFSLLVGSGSVYAPGLAAGADGGVLALANVVPERASDIYRLHADGETDAARKRNAALVELNRAITARYGVPGLKAVLKHRSVPAGVPRKPFQPVADAVRAELATLLEEALEST